MNLKEVTQEQLDRIAFLINNRPRKRLGYRTPLEVFQELRETPVALRM